MAIEIVDFPIKNGGSFHSYVKLPEGIGIDDMLWDFLVLFLDTPRAYVTLGVHPILRTVLVGVNDCNGIGGYEISCFGMLRYGWFQPKQTNKQTINHRYTIYGIEKKNNPNKTMGFFPWVFFSGISCFFFTGYKTNFRMVDLNGISPPTIGI